MNGLSEDLAMARGDLTVVQVVFASNSNGKAYSFLCTEKLAKTLDIDDLVVVDTDRGPGLGLVRSIEDTIGDGTLPQGVVFKFVFDKVDLNALRGIVEENKKIFGDLAADTPLLPLR